MPHSTAHATSHMSTPSQNRSSNANGGPAHNSSGGTEKFPDFDSGHIFDGSAPTGGGGGGGGGTPQRWQQDGNSAGYGYGNGSATNSDNRWHARRDSRVKWAPGASPNSSIGGHGRKLSNAINRIRAGSMSQNAHEIADALRAPVSWKLIMLCVMWYWSSALTNTSSKSILTAFDKPATLTIVQFGFVSSYCILFSWLASTFPKLRTWVPALKHPIRYPSKDVINTTLPLAAFQIGGHLLSSTATSKIPVSLVHTIKGLSPLFTVLAYRFIFDIRYPRATYLSLIPLTTGVMLACSGKHSFGGQFLGILYALLATIIFVTQNIFSKRLFNEAARAEQEGLGAQSRKLDKLNLLCYSSGMAFILTCPIWLWSEGIGIIGDFLWDGSVDLTVSPNSFDHGRLTLEYIFNGTFHFGQNILAFVLLSTVSPVTYSVASLIKRVFVIFIAIIWFRSPTTNVQAVGITLTFLGLYLYDRSSAKNKADQRARSMTETRNSLLPTSAVSGPSMHQSPVGIDAFPSQTKTNGYGYTPPNISPFHQSPQLDSKKSDDFGRAMPSGERNRGASNAWLAPGTRAEDTWRAGDAHLVSAR